MKNADMAAMPVIVPADVVCDPQSGLTKREMVAMHIAAGFAADHKITTDNVVKWSIEVADKLLAELEKQQ